MININNKSIAVRLISRINTYALVLYQRIRFRDFYSNIKVLINLWGEQIVIPIYHRLPLYTHLYKNYSTNLKRISSYINFKYQKFVAIDVGANIGDSAILIRKGSNANILCIEGDKIFIEFLRKNLKNRTGIKILNTYVGDKNMVLEGKINNSDGTARIELGKDNTKIKIQKIDDLIKTSGKTKIKLLKIDTDGYEGKVIRGSTKIISSYKPVLFLNLTKKCMS